MECLSSLRRVRPPSVLPNPLGGEVAEPFPLLVRVLVCAECGEAWWDPRDRWRIYFTDDDPPSPSVYCEDCARAQFD
jgi:hypothetical protein